MKSFFSRIPVQFVRLWTLKIVLSLFTLLAWYPPLYALGRYRVRRPVSRVPCRVSACPCAAAVYLTFKAVTRGS